MKSTATLALIAALAVTMFSGCASDSQRLQYDLAPDQMIDVRVQGDEPFVIIENHGPGAVDVTFDADAVGAAGRRLESRTSRGRTVQHEERIRIESGAEPTRLTVDVRGGEGILSQGPAPRPDSPGGDEVGSR